MDSHGCNGRAVGKDLSEFNEISNGKDISFCRKQTYWKGVLHNGTCLTE